MSRNITNSTNSDINVTVSNTDQTISAGTTLTQTNTALLTRVIIVGENDSKQLNILFITGE